MKRLVKFSMVMMILLFTFAVMQSSAAAVTYYHTNKSDVPVWSQASSKSSKMDVLPYGTVLRVTGSTVNSANNLWYRLDNGCWVFSGNVSKHSHSYNNGGVCTARNCGYEWPYTIYSASGTFQVINTGGAKIWSRPYSNNSIHYTTFAYGSILSVNARTTNREGNEWYRLTDGRWVFSGNVKQRFSVTFNANGGSGAPSVQYVLKDTSFTLNSKKPVRNGYIFKGWATSSGSTTVKYYGGKSYKCSSDIKLYAVWHKCSHPSCTDGYCTSCKNEVDMTISGKYTKVESVSSNTSALKYLKKNVGEVKRTGTIPGLKKTVTRNGMKGSVTTCNGMVPQGLAFAGDYLLVSAYCACGKSHRSVIYVLDGSSRKYLTTLIVDDICHVGGLAKCGDYLWVCDTGTDSKKEKILRGYKYSHIKEAVSSGRSYYTLPSAIECTTAVSPSYMCCANGYLYVGTFYKDSTTAKIYYYTFNNSLSDPKMNNVGYFTVKGVNKIQGISIRNNKMVITSSYGRYNSDTSKVYVYSDPTNFTTDKAVYDKPIKKFNFANMVEGCYIGENYTYFLVESAAKKYRNSLSTRPLDKYVSFSNSTIKTNKD